MAEDLVYRVAGLSKRYRNAASHANFGIDLEIARGDVFGLYGANGAGKSTLVRQLMNLVRPSAGEIYLEGRAVIGASELVAAKVGYLPQQQCGFYGISPRELIYRTGRLRGLGRAEAAAATSRLLVEWQLSPYAEKWLVRLSGGQRRLVALAMALIGDLPVLILDEPTNELDPMLRRAVWHKLLDLSQNRGKTVLLVTHNLVESEQVVNRVAIMRNGRIAATGTPAALKRAVDARVRLEVRLHEQTAFDRPLPFPPHVQVIHAAGGRLLLHVPRERLSEALQLLMRSVSMDRIEDLNVRSASLEEIYGVLEGETGDGAVVRAQCAPEPRRHENRPAHEPRLQVEETV